MDINVYVHLEHQDGQAPLDRLLTEITHIKQTTNDIKTKGAQIMSAISDFASKQSQFNANSRAAVESIATAIDGITLDISDLNAQIATLQATPGKITPEDQALLDGLTTAGEELTVKLTTISSAMATLDALVPPTIPPVV